MVILLSLKTAQRGFLENIIPKQQSKDIPIWMEAQSPFWL